MDRYTVESVDPYDMEPAPYGMWVMYDDAKAAIDAERERFRAPLTAFAADLRACVPILTEHGMAETAAEFAKGAAELEALLGPNVRAKQP